MSRNYLMNLIKPAIIGMSPSQTSKLFFGLFSLTLRPLARWLEISDRTTVLTVFGVTR